jgi:hypothetical protein
MTTHRCVSSLFLLALGLSGCAHARQRVYLQPGQLLDLKTIDLHKQSMIIPLKAGEVFPLDISVDGQFVSTQPGASVPLTVKSSCFLRVDDRGLRISVDGRDFDTKPKQPGTFQIGLGVMKEGKRASLRVVTPRR